MTDLPTLARITRAGYDREKQKLQQVIAEETALRTELARLGEMEQQARKGTDDTHRSIGADVIWQGWLGRARTDLNMKLARVLAVKAHRQTKVRKAYGKVLVLDELLAEAQNTSKQRLAKQALLRAIDQSLF